MKFFVGIINNSCIINGKTYNPLDPDSWKPKKYKANVVYKFEK